MRWKGDEEEGDELRLEEVDLGPEDGENEVQNSDYDLGGFNNW